MSSTNRGAELSPKAWAPRVGEKAMLYFTGGQLKVVTVKRVTQTMVVTSDEKRWRRKHSFNGLPMVPFSYRNPCLKPYDAQLVQQQRDEEERSELFWQCSRRVDKLRHRRCEVSADVLRKVMGALDGECERLGVEVGL